MNDGKLVSMANQIATFFRSYPEEEARAGIRTHLKAFWTAAPWVPGVETWPCPWGQVGGRLDT